jgi:hypothetical protein
MKRPLTKIEMNVIRQVAEKLPKDQQDQLLRDLAHAQAEPATPDGSRVIFYISGYQRPPYRGQHSYGAEGELIDRDGETLSFDLFADENERLLELELIRWAGGPLIEPDWDTFKLY